MFLTGVAVVFALCVYWTVRAYKTKTKAQFWSRVIVLSSVVFFILFVNELIPGSKTFFDYRYTKKIVGKRVKLNDVFICVTQNNSTQ